jgi:hypothetical protein
MSKSSLAAQAVANGPMSVAPPSFDGHGWLVVINLAVFTAAALVCAMAAGKMILDLWRDGHRRGPLVVLLRGLMLLIFGGMTIRTGVEALSLWGWDPHDPVTTGTYLFVKRLLDPLGGAAYLLAACVFRATDDALVSKLEQPPFPLRLVTAFHKLRRPAILAGMSLVAATLVVSLR